ncbi:MAG: RCC1 domain-containing protein [Gemmatimonadales bacterium]
MRRLVGGLRPALLLAVLGCGDDPQAPTPAGGTTPEARPTLATAATAALSFRQVSTGDAHACGVTADSMAYCWGYNKEGQLGDGTTTSPRLTPVAVHGGLHFRTVTAGAVHTCGVTGNGKAYCWGNNSLAALGDGTTSQRLTPSPVQGGLTFRTLTAGYYYTCGVTTDDRAYCWGWNAYGQLGNGTFSDNLSVTPTAVTGGIGFRLLATGIRHTCGISTANRAYCWGDNRYGQLGDSTTFTSRPDPTRVAGGRSYQWLDAGNYHTCATTTDGRAFCWGNGGGGQLGNGKTYLSFWPRRVAGGLLFRNITAGAAHSCGVGTDGRAYCWGNSQYGQIGDGTTTQRLNPALVARGLPFLRLSGGEAFSCGVTGAGKAYCWGGNWVGQLGDGTSISPRLTPRAVAGPM